MTTRTITDRQVAALPLHGGRAELLEEIMSTPVDQVDHVDHSPEAPTPHRRRTWTVVAAAAAVVATVGALAAWPGPHDPAQPRPDGPGFTSEPGPTGGDRTVTRLSRRGDDGPLAPSYRVSVTPAAPPRPDQLARPATPVPGGAYVALDQEGWAVTGLSDGPTGLDLSYQRGSATLELTTYPASQHASYVGDRRGDLGDGDRLTVLGRSAELWSYAPDDHEILSAADGDRFLGVRGSGLTEQEFRTALAHLVPTDAAGFARSLPPGVVTPDNREQAIRHLLRGVEMPPGFTAADVDLSGFNDAYQSAATVAGSVGCAWVDVWADGSEADRQAAIDAFEGSRSWPLLREIAHEGGYSSVFWSVADRLRAGHTDKGQPVTADGIKAGICS